MCIANSVGKGCPNAREDVRTIQLLLNLNAARVPGFAALDPDGAIGANTLKGLAAFGRAVLDPAIVLERVDVGSPALAALAAGMPAAFSQSKLRGVMVRASPGRIQNFFDPLEATMAKYHVDTPLRRAHFLAQVGHETMELVYVEEIASGEAYEYSQKLGNTQPGDGPRFKGRGLIQLTGRANYRDYGNAIGLDLLVNDNWKRVSSDPVLNADVAGWFWQKHGINAVADTDNIEGVTRIVNGGSNGLDNRKRILGRAKFFLPVP